MGDGDLCSLDLPVAGFPAELACRFDEQQDAVLTRVAIRESAPVGVKWELPTWANPAVLNKVENLTAPAEAEGFDAERGGDCERVVHLEDVNVSGSDAGAFERILP